ncbi:MAG: CvpA family protein [Eubacteriales bacterium]|nr:CvpA family protein [Eubacteriales bacterium]
MSAVLDIAIAVIIGLSVFFGARNGFVKTAISIGSVIIAIIVVVIFAPKLQGVFLESSAADSVREEINEKLANMVSSSDENYDPDEVKERSEFKKLLEIVGIDSDEFEAKWDSWKQNQTDELRDDMVNYISEPLVKAIAMLLAFIILFFGSIIVLKLVAILLDKICVLPVLKQANTLLGILLGVILALVKVSIFVYIVNLLLPYFQAKDLPLLSRIDPSSTILFRWFEKIDIISWLL